MHTATTDAPTDVPDLDRRLRGRALRGAALTFVRYGGAQILRLLSNLILSRLLLPEAFGLMALISVLMQGLQMFSDVGIRPSIVRSERGDDPDFLDTAWTVQAVRGAGQWLFACVLAAPFARFYGEPLLAQMVPVAGFSAVVLGLGSTKQYTQDRSMQIGRLVVMDLVANASGILVMVVLAVSFRSVWALIAGGLVTPLVRTCMTWLFLPGRNNRVRWEPQAREELFSFGRWVFISTMLTFASQSADRLLFGKLVSLEMLGVYSIGKMIAAAPIEAVSQISVGVVFPLYSRIVASGRPLSEVFARVRRPLLVLAGFGLSGLAACGGSLIEVLYDHRYADAGWVLQVLAVAAWFTVLWNVNMAALLALGQSKWMAANAAVKTVSTLIAVPLGAHIAGFHGAVVALVAAEALQCVVTALVVRRYRLAAAFGTVPLTLLVFAAAACGYAAPVLLELPPLPALFAGAAVVVCIWLPIAWPMLRMLRDRDALVA